MDVRIASDASQESCSPPDTTGSLDGLVTVITQRLLA